MSIALKIKNNHKNRVIFIKKMKNGLDKDMAIGSFVADLGKNSINAVSKLLGISWRKVKKCHLLFKYGYTQLSIEMRGRKKAEVKYPHLKSDIEKVIEKYTNVDSHFKTDTLYVTISPKSLINELVNNYNYKEKFISYNTIDRILKDMSYKLKRISKTLVQDKVPETDDIFENVNNAMESAMESDNSTAVISIDDKATKKIGQVSDGGKSRLDVKALDHDTKFDYSMKPFGILDLKTNETFVTCTPYSSTSEFKVYCIEEYVKYKSRYNDLERLIIFLDNGPENGGRRKLWLKKLSELSTKYKLIIELVYYPPYHSKYNKIERFWARLQMFWNGIVMDSTNKLIWCLNKVTWNGVLCKGNICWTHYQKGIEVSDYTMKCDIEPHLIREEGLEKWSIIVTPYAN